MAKYHSTGFAFDRANIAGLDKDAQRNINRYLTAREREINTIDTVEVWCKGGPLNGQMIETQGEGTLDLCIGAWRGRYTGGGEWVGSEGKAPEAPEVQSMNRRPASVGTGKDLGKGFAALAQLLADLGADPLERAEYVRHCRTVDVTEGAKVDDFGSVISVPRADGTYFVFKDYLNARLIGLGKRKKWFYPEKVEAYRVEAGHLVDDFGNLFAAPKQAEARMHPTRCIVMRARASYTIGRTVYTIDATQAAADRLRDKITAKKSIYSDRVLTAAEKQNAAARAARAVAQSVASAQAEAAIEQAQTSAAIDAMAQPAEAVQAEQPVRALECVGAMAADAAPGAPGAVTTGHAHANPGGGDGARSGSAGAKIVGKSGKWSARFFVDAVGDAAMEFCGPSGRAVVHSYASGSERMRALQAMARGADKPGELQITLERVEGLSDDMGKPETVGSFAEADALLIAWSETAPKNGGYNKTDFYVAWPDGEQYRGRYDLQHHSVARPSLVDHMAGFCEYMLGLRKPEHMSEAQYRQDVSTLRPECVAEARDQLERIKKHAGYFAKMQPVAVALGDLVAQGLPVDKLAGLGVRDTGGGFGSAKSGAIVLAELCRWHTVRAATVFEDGTREVLASQDFGPDGRYRIDGKVHGAPYLAQLAAAEASRHARTSAAAETAKQAHAKALIELEAQYPHLVRTTKHGGVAAAANIRRQLKKHWPGVIFSVRSDYNSVHVRWTGGPLSKDVDAALAPFDVNDNDSMTDYAGTKSTAFSELFGGVHYLNTSRDNTEAEIQKSLIDLFGSDGPTVDDYQKSRRWSTVQHGNGCRSDAYRDEWQWLSDVRRHASGTFDY